MKLVLFILLILLVSCNTSKESKCFSKEEAVKAFKKGSYFHIEDQDKEILALINLLQTDSREDAIEKLPSYGRRGLQIILSRIKDKSQVKDIDLSFCAKYSPRDKAGTIADVIYKKYTLRDHLYDISLWIIGPEHQYGKFGFLFENEILWEWFNNHKDHTLEEMRESLNTN